MTEKKGSGRDARHDEAADEHDKASKRHARAAWGSALSGDEEMAALERRDSDVEHDAAGIDRDRARLQRKRDRDRE